MATKRHKSFDSKVSSFDRAGKTADSLENKIELKGKTQESKNESYRSEQEGEKSGKYITKATREITGFITKVGQFLAKGKVSRYEFAAKAAALIGDKEGARNLMAKAKAKSDRTMEKTGKVNDAVRGAADWTIDAKDSVVQGTKTAVEVTGRAIGNATRATGRAAVNVAGVAAYGVVEGAKAVGRGFKNAFTSTIKFGSDLVERGAETVEQIKEDAQIKMEQRTIARLRGQISKRKDKLLQLEEVLQGKEAMAAARTEKDPTQRREAASRDDEKKFKRKREDLLKK